MWQEQRSLLTLPMKLLREEEYSAATFSKWSKKIFFRIALCGQRVRKTMSEGMGVLRASGTRLAPTGAAAETAIPIKVAEGRTKRKMRKVSDTGESCPEIVTTPQICKNSGTIPPINPRKNASKATPEMCKMKNFHPFLIQMVPFRLIFLGLVEGGTSFMDEKRSYTVKELQEILQVSRPAVYELLKQKQFEWVVVGGKYRISKKSFDRWFDGDDAE